MLVAGLAKCQSARELKCRHCEIIIMKGGFFYIEVPFTRGVEWFALPCHVCRRWEDGATLLLVWSEILCALDTSNFCFSTIQVWHTWADRQNSPAPLHLGRPLCRWLWYEVWANWRKHLEQGYSRGILWWNIATKCWPFDRVPWSILILMMTENRSFSLHDLSSHTHFLFSWNHSIQ